MNAGKPARKFPTTRWTLVRRAVPHQSSKEAERACDDLLQLYRPALLTHLGYSWRMPQDQAEDLVHDFILKKILLGDLLASANRERGKFRTLLLTSLDRYAVSSFRKRNSVRRSPGRSAVMSLDQLTERIEKSTGEHSPSVVFDLAWIRELINETLRQVKCNCESTGRAHYWALLEDRVVNPILHGDTPTPYAQLVNRLGFSSPLQAACALVTVKHMFERTFRSIILDYSCDEGAVEREMKELHAILSDLSAYQ
ncbi:MAG: sigma-70 family RNA polymerase sigma factor [Kiritimatiellae bacterium]|nr:sigma-70 family RNA polymerase sigma factor [Kiritimatiellia bacterium]